MTVDKLIEAHKKAIAFLIKMPNDLCSKCVYFKGIDGYDENGSCELYDKHGAVACQEGVVEHFKRELDNDDN